jgi:hypothetical protein
MASKINRLLAEVGNREQGTEPRKISLLQEVYCLAPRRKDAKGEVYSRLWLFAIPDESFLLPILV